MLKDIVVKSIYGGAPLPRRMATCSPDMAIAIAQLEQLIVDRGGSLVLSDLFRSHDMQLQARLDYTSGKKKAFSPAPGGSMHEAGRAMDIDIAALAPLSLVDFWELSKPLGFCPIIAKPNPRESECWHFDFRGSFQKIYDYQVKHPTGVTPYARMASLAILDQGITVYDLEPKRMEFLIQSALVRLDEDIWDIDGMIGPECMQSLDNLMYKGKNSYMDIFLFLNKILQDKYSSEYCQK